jgi:hypothetical protein
MARSASESQRVALAKQQLRGASQRIDYLAPVKEHPLASVGAAFMAGMLWRKAGKGRLPPGLLTIGLQLLKRL